MTTREPDDTKRKDLLPGEAELARVYRAGGNEAPPPTLDARIQAESRRAVAKLAARRPFASRWAVPLSTAAVMVLTLGILLVVNEQSPQDITSPLPSRERGGGEGESRKNSVTPSPQPSPIKGEGAAPDAPSAITPKGSEIVGKTDRPESTPGTDSLLRAAPPLVEEAKKLDRATTGAAAPAPRRESIADERVVGGAQGEDRAKAKLAKEANMRIAADVISVQVSGAPEAYQFNVTVQSPDTGCQQYADWWEVVSADGKLLHRRVLVHSHVNEQPFTRSGGPVAVQPDSVVWVRAHMNIGGYGGAAFKGSVKAGFAKAEPLANFAAGLANLSPLPDGCAF